MKKRLTNAELLKRLEAAERKIAELEKVAHPQAVLADPDLTEAIKRVEEMLRQPRTPLPFVYPNWQPQPWLNPVLCGTRTTVC